MAITQTKRIQARAPASRRGFSLLIALIFMSVMLSFGLALASISYKQQVLASSALESQYAFYAADAGLECALYYDQQQDLFAFPTQQPISAPLITCDGSTATYPPSYSNGIVLYGSSQWVITERISLDPTSQQPGGTRCADITVYKQNPVSPSGPNYIFSQGYDVPCSVVQQQQNNGSTGARISSRGLQVQY